MSQSRPKRFYSQVGVAPENGGYAVTLDERRLRTPLGAPLTVPSLSMAEAIAGEWQDQGDLIRPETMPLTQLAATAIDRVKNERNAIVGQLMQHATTDLLCHRAAGQRELADLQEENWQPLLDWAARDLGARLAVTEGIIPVRQPQEALDALRLCVEELSDLELAPVANLAAVTSSLVVALALLAGVIDAEDAFNLSHIEEIYQAELWGDDEEAVKRRESVRAEIESAAHFIDLLQGEVTDRGVESPMNYAL